MLEKIVGETHKIASLLLAGTCGFYVHTMGLDEKPVDALQYFFIGGYVPSLVFGVDAFVTSYFIAKKRRTALCDLRGAPQREYHVARLNAVDDASKEAIMPSIMGAGWGMIAYSLGYCGMKLVDTFQR